MNIIASSISETGQVRPVNQDALFFSYCHNWGLFALADGMGGHSQGERASQEVILSMKEFADNMPLFSAMEIPEILRKLRAALSQANERILKGTQKGLLCGSTAVVMVLLEDACILVSAGDSRCYEFNQRDREVRLTQLTVDDVVGGTGPGHEKLTNGLGVRSPFQCRSRIFPLKGTHDYLICSDGIYKYLPPEELKQALLPCLEGKPDISALLLRNFSELHGSRDNYSAILVHVEDTHSDLEDTDHLNVRGG